jgi:hypothetical protein
MSEELHMSDELLSVVVVIGQTFVKNLRSRSVSLSSSPR